MFKLLPLAVGAFALGMDAYVIAGLLVALGSDLHQSLFAVGLMVTMFTLAYALLAPLCATFIAGRPMRAVLLVALGIFTAGNILSAVAPSLGVLLLARALAGLGAGLYAPAAAATAASLVAPRLYGRALSSITVGMSAGAAVGVPLGVLLSDTFGWRSCMWLITSLGVVAFIGIALTMTELLPASPPAPLSARFAILANRHVALIVLVTLASSLSNIGAYTYVADLLHDTLGAPSTPSYLWAWGFGGIVGSLGVGILIDVCKNTRMLQSAILALLAAALLTFPLLGTSPIGALAGLFIWGAAGWATVAPQQHRLLASAPEHGAVVVALNSSGLYLGSAIGAAIGGLIVDHIGAQAACIAFGSIAATFALVNRLVTGAGNDPRTRHRAAPRRPSPAQPSGR